MIKAFAVLFVAAIGIGLLDLWCATFIVGGYYRSSGSFLLVLGLMAPVVVLYAVYKSVREILKSKGV